MNDLFKKRNELAQKLASMTTDDVLKIRTGYAGKSQQWQYGFDLACREKQAEIDALKAQNADLLAAQQWQPIDENTPKNTHLLLLAGNTPLIGVGLYDSYLGHWSWKYGEEPTLWMPLPLPPEAKARGDL